MSDYLATPKDREKLPARPMPRADRLCRLVRFEPWAYPNDRLVGHCYVDFGGWQIHRIPIFRRKDGTLSAGVPNTPEVDRDGLQLRDENGKRRYAPLMSFSGDGKARWERAVLQALCDAGIVP